jgi:hypothetical protein
VEDLQQGRKKFHFGDYHADYSYWFVSRKAAKIREAFLGSGGLTTLFIRSKSEVPPVSFRMPKMMKNSPLMQPLLAQFDLEETFSNSSSLMDGFHSKSKQLFGSGLEHDPQFRGLLYIVPLLSSGEFFANDKRVVDTWFELFDVYLHESPEDKGIILAARENLDSILMSVTADLRERGLTYAE